MVDKNRRKMKKIMLLPILIILVNCNGLQNYYSGYVYDEISKEPLSKVFIKENFYKNIKSTYSNENGYFRINNNTESIGNLIFIHDGYKTDTIITAWSQHGESLKYRFIGKKGDTLFMKKIEAKP